MFFVYFLKSDKNGKIYCGQSTRHPEIRLKEHNRGLNLFTKQNGPFQLLYFEEYLCKEDARKKELFYKTGFGRKVRDAILREVASARG